MNILFCSAGRRVELLREFKRSMRSGKVVVTDVSPTAPAIYVADTHYDAGLITEEGYIDRLTEICRKEKIDVITTLIDPEIEILASHRAHFQKLGVLVLAPDARTAALCFDKAKLIAFLSDNGIQTVRTWDTMGNFQISLVKEEIGFPVFAKPRTGSGRVGAHRRDSLEQLEKE